MSKYLAGLIRQFDKLVEESGDIFEEEHPWLFDSSIEKPEIKESPRRERHDLEMENLKEAIGEECARIETLRKSLIPPPVQLKLTP